MLKLIVNGKVVYSEEGKTILEVCREEGIDIPTFCYDERLKPEGACRMCIVELKGKDGFVCSCTTPVADGMEVYTHSEKVINARREILHFMLSEHQVDCLTCKKSGECKLQDYCYEYDVDISFCQNNYNKYEIDDSNPFYYRDMNKCILCGKCVRVCESLQCSNILTFINRGDQTHIGAEFNIPIEKTECVSCGNCVSVCPTGALMPKQDIKYRYWEVEKVKTTCPYCGVGCQMQLLVKDNKVVEVQPLNQIPNDGLLCVKGRFGYKFINHKDRLKQPLVKKNGEFVEVTWDEAYSYIVNKTIEIKQKYGADSLAGLSSARCTNEENYLFQKLFRAVIGTNNVDHCARLCHASTVAGLAKTLGSGAMTNSIDEIQKMDTIFITGSNTTENHPVIGAKIKQAVKKGTKLIVADPRNIELANYSDVFLQIKPGTNIALINGMISCIVEEDLYDKEYLREKVENYNELINSIKDWTPKKAAEICGVDEKDLRKAAMIYAKADKASIFYSMGVTQHSTGTNGVISVSNLALLCGNIGIEGGGVNPLRGQNNVQGACDMGALPGDLPGYQKVFDTKAIEKFENAWKTKLSTNVGLTVSEIFDNAYTGDIKLLYIMGENPMISDPDINHVEKALNKLDCLVVQDIFLSETAKFADVVLPAASFAEKDGTFTNTERRIQRIRKAINPVGNSKADWEIIVDIMNGLGYEKEYKNASEIMDEIGSVTPQYGGVSYDRLEEVGLQWPCLDKNHMGTKYLHKDKFSRGKALMVPVEYLESDELPDDSYPLILTTGRMLYHYHTRTMTGRVEGLNKIAGESYIEVNPVTAEKLGIKNSEKIKVISRRGEVTSKAVVTDKVNKDVVFMPFHFADGAANYLTNTKLDDIAKIPELKVCAVRIEKIHK